MNKETMNHFIGSGKATMDRSGQTTMGILTPCPLLYETEIIGEENIVLYWYGDRDNMQREFPLLITPRQFNQTAAANIMLSSVLSVGTMAEFKRNNLAVKSSRGVIYCDETLDKKTVLVGGIVLGISFLFQVLPLEINERVVVPRSYFGD